MLRAGPQLGNLSPVPCHCHSLSACNAVEDLAAVIAKIAHANRRHRHHRITGETWLRADNQCRSPPPPCYG